MAIPGKNFLEMLLLIVENHRKPNGPFSPQLLMAIFWEETMFNNIRQVTSTGGAGRGVGFGQVEKQELPKLSTQKAIDLGYFVPGMTAASTQLPDHLSVQIASCMLLHLYHASSSKSEQGKIDFALRGYSGNRQEIINGWKRCESLLKQLPFSLFRIVNFPQPLRIFENKVMDALSLTRPFKRDAKVVVVSNGQSKLTTFHDVLFPTYWFFPPAMKDKMLGFLPAGKVLTKGAKNEDVKTLQIMLNAQRKFYDTPLKSDGAFGPKTYQRVIDYQKDPNLKLVADGIVGKKTKSALLNV